MVKLKVEKVNKIWRLKGEIEIKTKLKVEKSHKSW
jgi:hypothetical protein